MCLYILVSLMLNQLLLTKVIDRSLIERNTIDSEKLCSHSTGGSIARSDIVGLTSSPRFSYLFCASHMIDATAPNVVHYMTHLQLAYALPH